jgi:glycosyltransferase involved in cell wall biosynthesis
VHRLHPPDIGGISLHAHALSQAQAGMGHQVIVFTSQQYGMPKHEFRSGYEIYRFPELAHPLENPLTVSMVPALVAGGLRRVDVVHAHSHLFFSTNLAALKRKMSSTPLVITNHGFRVQRGSRLDLLQDIYLNTMGAWTLRAADKVISLTSDEARRVSSLRVDPSRSIVIPNGVDLDLFHPTGEKEAEDTILWAGRFVEEKGVRYLLEAVRLISKEMPSVRLLLVGYGPLEDRLKSHAQRVGVSKNVVFQAPVDQRTLASLFNKCAVFALPSLSEGLPNVVLEAMACARPVVATDGIGLNSVIGDAGIFVPPRDPRSLADATLRLLSDSPLRAKLGLHARSIVVKRYSWRSVAEVTTRLFQRLIDLRHASPS